MKKFHILSLLLVAFLTITSSSYLRADPSDDWTAPTARGASPVKSVENNKTAQNSFQSTNPSYEAASGQVVHSSSLSVTRPADRARPINPRRGGIATEDTRPEPLRYYIKCPQAASSTVNPPARNISNAAQASAEIASIMQRHGTTATIKHRFTGLALCGVSVKGEIDPATREALENAGYSITLVDKVYAMLDTSVDVMRARKVQVNQGLGTTGTATGRGIRIGILDTGIDYTHPQLGGCTTQQFLQRQCEVVVDGYDFISNDPDPMDDVGHGTHVAATAAGRGDPSGVAPQAELVGIKVLDQYGEGGSDDVAAGLEWALDPNRDGNTSDRLDVVNLSLGILAGPGDELSNPSAVAAQALARQGVVVIAAAGNEGGSSDSPVIICPACASSVLAVAATTNTLDVNELETGWFSSWGSYRAAAGLLGKPELSAPGVDICAARASGAYSSLPACNGDPRRVKLFGTSMAAPHIAGAAALLFELFPNSTALEIRQMLVNQARFFRGTQLARAGFGLVQLDKLTQAIGYPPVIELAPLPYVPANGTTPINGTITSRRGIKSITILAARSATEDLKNMVEMRTISLSNFPQSYTLNTSIVLPDVFSNTQSIVVRVKDQGGAVSSAWTEARSAKPVIVNPENLEAVKAATPYTIDIDPVTPGLATTWSIRDLNGLGQLEPANNPLVLPRNSAFELIGTQTLNGRSRTFSTYVQGDTHLTFNSPLRATDDPTLFIGRAGYVVGSALPDNSHLLYTIAARCNSASDYMNALCPLNLVALSTSGSVRWSAPLAGNASNNWAAPVEIKTPSVHGIFTLSQCNTSTGCRVLGFNAATGAALPGWSNPPASGLSDFAIPSLHAVPSSDGLTFKIVMLARYRERANQATPVDRVYVYNANGALAQRWSPPSNSDPLYYTGTNLGLPTFGNFDADPDLEIAFMNAAPGYIRFQRERSAIYAYNLDGSLLNGWPRELEGNYILTNPVSADLDRDGRDEIITQTSCGYQVSADCQAVHAFKGDGTIVPGWPAQLPAQTSDGQRSLAVADVDEDGTIETLVCYDLRGCTLINATGQKYRQSPQWPRAFQYASDGIFSHSVGGPFIADINNDGTAEILLIGFSPGDDMYLNPGYLSRWKLVVLSAMGEELTSLEQFLPSTYSNPNARWQLADWDNDGNAELHAGWAPWVRPLPDQSLSLSRLKGHFVHTTATPFPVNVILWNGAGGNRGRLNRAGSGF